MENLNNPFEEKINQLNTDMLKRLEQQLEICKNVVQNRKYEKLCSELYNELKFDILKNYKMSFQMIKLMKQLQINIYNLYAL